VPRGGFFRCASSAALRPPPCPPPPCTHPTTAALRAAPRWIHQQLPEEKLPEGTEVPHVVDSLEWTLTSPPPLHQFDESPIVVETAHLIKD